MKIILFTGSGEASKRLEVVKFQQKYISEDITVIDLKQAEVKDLIIALSSQSLFGSANRLVVVENPTDSLDLEKINQVNGNVTMLLVAGQMRTDSVLLKTARLIKAQIINFEAEKEVSAFPYLDNLIEGKKEAFGELQKLLDGYGGMYVLSMIYYLLRRNLLPSPPSSFMQNKIKSQTQKIFLKDWQKLYLLTLKTDFSIKSGALPEIIALTKLTQEFVNHLR